MQNIFKNLLANNEIGNVLLEQIKWDDLSDGDKKWMSAAIGAQTFDSKKLTRD